MTTGALANQPRNLNPLSPLGFKFVIKKIPNVNYFCQSVAVPGISVSVAEQPTYLSLIPQPGARMTYEPLSLKFKVDENLANYLEIHNWLIGLGHPVSLQQAKNLSDSSDSPSLKGKPGSIRTYKSDATLVILTSHKNPSHYVIFRDLFPVALTELVFDSTQSDVTYLEANVTFRYLRYDIEIL